MKNTALLLIDFQNDYFPSYEGAKWALSKTEKAAEKGAQLLSAFRDKQFPVVHVRHEFPTNDAPFFLPESDGAQIHSSVTPLEGEPVIVKHQINSFRDTELNKVLKEQGVEKLIIVGAMSHMCIDAVTRAATDLGYECHVAHDACTTLDMEFNGVTVPAAHVHAAFMAALSFGYCNVATASELESLL
ncbi:cysteine hydrolase family protein [Vibrio sp. 14N.309.X.WAT.E.F5]|uniref:cysteine hydrolase family protein n=1 Tax=Vibrio TaxID=662 RepID=UPI000C84E692|nr:MULTISPECIES: cysteine hydrolase family protein [Vibrio]MDN2665898.1 cysteine hydrolase family protein [Vibrio sp. 14N.309.X.WAT.E.F5]MDN3629496.1 cysteine hydrolase family protein [Vibrio lentus]PMJ83105.1 Isochorismatase [Vibrio lentus]